MAEPEWLKGRVEAALPDRRFPGTMRTERRSAMNTRAYALTSGVIFFLVALVHLLRLIFHWVVVIDGWYVPTWVSVVSVLVAGLLSFQGFRLFRQSGWFSWLR